MDGFEIFMTLLIALVGIAIGSAVAGALVAWQFDVSFLRAMAGSAAGAITIATARAVTK